MFLSSTCSAAFRTAITAEGANMIVYALSSARGSTNANAVLYGVSSKIINRLQCIQNALARYAVDSKLHRTWFKRAATAATLAAYIPYRIKFKIEKFAFLARSSNSSKFISQLISGSVSTVSLDPFSRRLSRF